MLTNRIIGVLTVRDGIVVQSIGFRRYLPVGRPEIAVEYLNRWGIDEILLVDIGASSAGRCLDAASVRSFSRQAQVPFAAGGGVRSVHDIEAIIRSGADKVVINTAAIELPEVITEGARLFGNQCIVVSIDARRTASGVQVLTRGGRVPATGSVAELARRAEGLGAGEILVTSIDRDGSKRGYDLDLIRMTADSVRIPVIACGGVGRPDDLLAGISAGASAVAAGNFFHYTEHSVAVAKAAMRRRGATVRLDGAVTYHDAALSADERIGKRDDAVLDRLRFEHVPEEVI
jgi:cyclase